MVRHLQPWRSWRSWRRCVNARNHHIASTSRGVAFAGTQTSLVAAHSFDRDHPQRQQPRHHRGFSSNRASSQVTAESIAQDDQAFVQEGTLQKSAFESTHSSRGTESKESGEVKAKDGHSNTSQGPLSPPSIRQLPVEIDARTLSPIIETLREARKLGLPDAAQTLRAAPPIFEKPIWQHNQSHLDAMSTDLFKEWDTKRSNPSAVFRRLLQDRSQLPVMADETQNNILQLLKDNDVLIIRANTGSGKTTQIPQLILDHEIKLGKGAFCNIAITQPRRLSATSVAKRVAIERDENLGESVGFHVRFKALPPQQKGSLIYCTAGVLLKQLRTRQDFLSRYSHLIIDEVHERSMITDCTLTMLRDLLRQRKTQRKPYPKLILMSATIESGFFSRYFEESSNDVSLKSCNMVIAGRQYPVETHFLQDFLPEMQKKSLSEPIIQNYLEGAKGDSTKKYIEEESRFVAKWHKGGNATTLCEVTAADGDLDTYEESDSALVEATEPEPLLSPIGLVAATVLHVLEKSSKGDILVFLVGLNDIEKTAHSLSKHPDLAEQFQGRSKLRLFKLHSLLAETNDDVFEPVPEGCRRVVLATNIAETSITLPDVEHVIDLGKVRQRLYEPQSRLDVFPSVWISRSNRKQREGRAGRVRPGHYYALFSRERSESFEATIAPEITRMDLAEPCLDLKASPVSANVREFLKRAPSPPKPEAVESALLYLQTLGALTPAEEMSPLGRLLANIPIHPSMMKAALLGILFQCLEPMLIIACQNIDDNIISTFERGTRLRPSRRRFAAGSESDFVTQVNAFKEYEKAHREGDAETMRSLEQDHFVQGNLVREVSKVARQVCEELSYAGLLPDFPDRERSIFEAIPPMLNKNADCIPLLKALTMNLFNSDISIRKYSSPDRDSPKNFYAATNSVSALSPRSVNFERNRSHEALPRKLLKSGDLMSYIMRKQDGEQPKISWLINTTMITPLISIIFGRTVNETIASNTGANQAAAPPLLVNGWISMSIAITPSTSPLPTPIATRLLIEFRRAFERFCILAFTDLEEAAAARVADLPEIDFFSRQSGGSTVAQNRQEDIMARIGQEMVNKREKKKYYINQQLRTSFVEGTIRMLKADEEAMRDGFERDKVEYERMVEETRLAKERAKMEREEAGQRKAKTRGAAEQERYSTAAEENQDGEGEGEGEREGNNVSTPAAANG